MKKVILAIFVAMAWCSCYDDKGNYDYRDLDDLQVAIAEEGPHSIMYGDLLKLTLEVKTSVPDADLQFDWEVQMDSAWYGPFVSVAQGRELNYKWENEVLNKEKTWKLRLNVTQLSSGRHFYSAAVDVAVRLTPSALGLMVLHGDGTSSDIGVIEAPEFQLQQPAADFQSRTTPDYYSSHNGNEKIPGTGTGLWQTFPEYWSAPRPERIVIVALTEQASVVAESKTLEKKGDWGDMFFGGLNAGRPGGIVVNDIDVYIFDGEDIFWRQGSSYRVVVPKYAYEEGSDNNGFKFYPQLFGVSGVGQAVLFDVEKKGFVSCAQTFSFDEFALINVDESGIPFNPGRMGADLLHWETGGKYGLVAVMQGENNGPVFIAEMYASANDRKEFPKYKYDLSHIGDVTNGEVVGWAFGDNQINMGYYATARGVYHFALDDGNTVNPTKLTMENNAEVAFEGEITFVKILKPRATGGNSYYMNNVLMVVGTYGGTAGSGKLYSLELDPNSGKVKSRLGVYEGFDRIYEADIKGY